MRLVQVVVSCWLASASLGALAQVCEGELTTPTLDFEYFGRDGLVLHKSTGLLWKMCSEGTQFDRKTRQCLGVPQLYYWPDQNRVIPPYAGFADWRLPSSREFRLLVEYGCQRPAINQDVFPNHPPQGMYWTSTSWMKPSADRAWVMDFTKGFPDARFKRTGAYVRLVREPSPEQLRELRAR
jgi:hypothetical protein